MKLCIVVGTRPEIIKMSPLLREAKIRRLSHFVLHTGQHYSHNMDAIFFDELHLEKPKYNLSVGSCSFADQIAKMLNGFVSVLQQEKPDFVLAEGDTNTVLAAVLASSHLSIPFVHVEAGLRSYNMQMQEEKNRLVADALADFLMAPTQLSYDILLKEGKNSGKVFLTGNTVVDAVSHYLPEAEKEVSISQFNLRPKQYFLVTVHRAENTDSMEIMSGFMEALAVIYSSYKLPVVFPVHPRTRKRLEDFNLQIPQGVTVIEPQGFFEFLILEKNACLVLTDSGGVQEECCILKVPCVTLRKDTERPETVHVGANVLTDLTWKDIIAKVGKMFNTRTDWHNPLGKGNAAANILDVLEAIKK